jgi:hypothetical protein
MAGNALYGKGRNKFARGEIHWTASGDTIKTILVDSADYTLLIDTNEFLSDVPSGARVATSAAMTLSDPALGVCDASDITFTAVSGDSCEYIIVYKDSGVEGTSPLLACIDTATGLPVTPSGGDIIIQWDSGTNKIFRL